ncbi:MAG: ABC transporter substrate-binding protein [Acidimicrobiia bacterium]
MIRSVNRRSRALAAVGLLTAFSALAAACGDDGGESAATTAKAAETTAAPAATTAAPSATTAAAPTTAAGPAKPTGDPVVLGLVTALTGPSASSYSPYGGNVAAAWEAWVNDKMGGIGGRPVKIVIEDSAAQAAQAQTAVKKLVEESKAIAIIVNDTTSETAISEYTAANNIPVIGGSTNAAAIWLGKPNYFMLGMTNPVSAASGMYAAKQIGSTSYGAAVCAEVPACAEAGKLYGALATQIPGGGLPFGGLVTASASAPNYTAECLSLIEKKVDWIQLGMAIAPGLKLAAECVKQGFTGTFGAGNQSIAGPPLEAVTGLKFGGNVSFFPWFADSPAAKTFRDVMETYKKGEPYQAMAGTTLWTTLELFRKVTKTAPTTSAEILKTYQGIANETLDGLLPVPVTFSATAPSPAIGCFWVVKLEGGKWSTVAPAAGTSGNKMTDGLATHCFTPKLG